MQKKVFFEICNYYDYVIVKNDFFSRDTVVTVVTRRLTTIT